jgi:hypothetical protein
MTSAVLVILFQIKTPNATAEPLVPFVGCPGGGMTRFSGPFQGDPVPVDMPPWLAAHLAFYAGDQTDVKLGVLAPRGWHCNSERASGHLVLGVVPYNIGPIFDFPEKDKPSVLLFASFDGTSGRFDLADTVKTYFPKLDPYVDDTLNEEKPSPGGTAAVPRLGSGIPYPLDSLSYLNDNTLAFVTPRHSIGLGAVTQQEISSYPTYGLLHVYVPNQYDGFDIEFTVRLPASSLRLERAILKDEQKRMTFIDHR